MDIMEIVKIQKECRAMAKALTREFYRKYDAIWTDGIKITPELEAMGENLIRDINRKMPNLLMRNHERPEGGEIAERYGFENISALMEYLLHYEPRAHYEELKYQTLLFEKLEGCSYRELELASSMTSREVMAVVRNCNRLAREITENAYEKYDEIWAGKMLITPELLKHGKETVNEINRKMPNFLTHNPICSAVDQIMMQYDFDSVQELIDWLLDYQPRAPYQARICDQLIREQLGLDEEDMTIPNFTQAAEVDEIPF